MNSVLEVHDILSAFERDGDHHSTFSDKAKTILGRKDKRKYQIISVLKYI